LDREAEADFEEGLYNLKLMKGKKDVYSSTAYERDGRAPG
jgi:hypothetical protein